MGPLAIYGDLGRVTLKLLLGVVDIFVGIAPLGGVVSGPAGEIDDDGSGPAVNGDNSPGADIGIHVSHGLVGEDCW